MAKYAKHVKTPVSQSEKARDDQVENSAGGYVFTIDKWNRLNRFLIIGNEGGSYYASEKDLTKQNYSNILDCIKEDGIKTVDTIIDISSNGRAVKNSPSIFALALCSVYGSEKTKAYANRNMPKVASYSTTLFEWVNYINILKEDKTGKGLLRAIANWYTSKKADTLAYQVCKYPERSVDGKKVSHRDLLRMARPAYKSKNGKSFIIPSEDHGLVFNYAVHGIAKNNEEKGLSLTQFNELKKSSNLKYIWAHEFVKNSTSIKDIVKVIEEYKVTRESLSPDLRNNIDVQRALLKDTPMTAMIRNLGQMTASGLLKPLSDEVSLVIEKITNEDNLKKARIHPMAILLALRIYEEGHGMRTQWEPVSAIVEALDKAFYLSFNYVEPTNKKYLLGVDVSSSMTWKHNNNFSPNEAAAVIAMAIAKKEKFYHILGFCDKLVDLKISPADSLSNAINKTQKASFGGTDCAQPMIYALEKKIDVDVFVVLTDNETWSGDRHPFEALKEYRKKMNPNAKLAVMAFTATDFSIADPSDLGMMDIAGLDTNVPKILSEFAVGNL